MFITFEGIEGCGKTTQIKLLAAHLLQHDLQVVLTREPGGCPIADQIRAILLDADNSAMHPSTELLLYCAARSQHIAQIIQPALQSGALVLCDRFSDATLAYQHFGRGIERSKIDLLNSFAVQGLKPDLTILIDTDINIGLPRAKSRINASQGPREERFELESNAFHQRVRDGYLQLAQEDPQRVVVVNGAATIDALAEEIAANVLARIKAGSHAVC